MGCRCHPSYESAASDSYSPAVAAAMAMLLFLVSSLEPARTCTFNCNLALKGSSVCSRIWSRAARYREGTATRQCSRILLLKRKAHTTSSTLRDSFGCLLPRRMLGENVIAAFHKSPAFLALQMRGNVSGNSMDTASRGETYTYTRRCKIPREAFLISLAAQPLLLFLLVFAYRLLRETCCGAHCSLFPF